MREREGANQLGQPAISLARAFRILFALLLLGATAPFGGK